MVQVDLITGFLDAGKTDFINGILNGVKDSLPAGAKNPPGQKTNGEND